MVWFETAAAWTMSIGSNFSGKKITLNHTKKNNSFYSSNFSSEQPGNSLVSFLGQNNYWVMWTSTLHGQLPREEENQAKFICFVLKNPIALALFPLVWACLRPTRSNVPVVQRCECRITSLSVSLQLSCLHLSSCAKDLPPGHIPNTSGRKTQEGFIGPGGFQNLPAHWAYRETLCWPIFMDRIVSM